MEIYIDAYIEDDRGLGFTRIISETIDDFDIMMMLQRKISDRNKDYVVLKFIVTDIQLD